MTVFVIVSAGMVAAALLWLITPLLRRRAAADDPPAYGKERRVAALGVAILVPALAIAMYARLSNWDWGAAESQAANAGRDERAPLPIADLHNAQETLTTNRTPSQLSPRIADRSRANMSTDRKQSAEQS